MKKNKFIGILMVLIFLVSIITVSAANPFSRGAYNIQNFFIGGWRGYDEILLFTLLFILFTAAFMLALSKAFGETNRQIKTIAVIIAIISALSIVSTTEFSLDQVTYIALSLAFLLLVLVIQGILLKMGVKSKLVAFILALIIAFFITFLLAKLLSEKPTIGRYRFFDTDLIRFKRGISLKFPEIRFEPREIGVREVEEVVVVGEEIIKEEVTTRSNLFWIIPLILIVLALASISARKGYRYVKKKRGEKEPKIEEKKIEKDIKHVTSEIEKIVELKKDILKKIINIVDKKEKLSEDLLDLYHKNIRDPAYYMDSGTLEFKALIEQNNDAAKLLKLELELEKQLEELMKIENELIEGGKLSRWLNFVHSFYGSKEKVREDVIFERLPPYAKIEALSEELKEIIKERGGYDKYCEALDKLIELFKRLYPKGDQGLLPDVKRAIARYFLISKEEKEAEKTVKKLTNYKKLEHWFKQGKYKKWKALEDKNVEQLKEFFNREKELLLGTEYPKRIVRGYSLYSRVHTQARYLLYILELIKFLESKRKSFTKIQELKVEPKDAASPMGVVYGTPLRIYTGVEQGIGPYDALLYIDDKPVSRKPIYSTERYPLVEWESREFGELEPGKHKISIAVMSPGAEEQWIADREKGLYLERRKGLGTYRRYDSKSIVIFINPKGLLTKEAEALKRRPREGIELPSVEIEEGEKAIEVEAPSAEPGEILDLVSQFAPPEKERKKTAPAGKEER